MQRSNAAFSRPAIRTDASAQAAITTSHTELPGTRRILFKSTKQPGESIQEYTRGDGGTTTVFQRCFRHPESQASPDARPFPIGPSTSTEYRTDAVFPGESTIRFCDLRGCFKKTECFDGVDSEKQGGKAFEQALDRFWGSERPVSQWEILEDTHYPFANTTMLPRPEHPGGMVIFKSQHEDQGRITILPETEAVILTKTKTVRVSSPPGRSDRIGRSYLPVLPRRYARLRRNPSDNPPSYSR
ncbi:hypothetical protein IAT40_004731 [Kwoniella sp. CBS 6097]